MRPLLLLAYHVSFLRGRYCHLVHHPTMELSLIFQNSPQAFTDVANGKNLRISLCLARESIYFKRVFLTEIFATCCPAASYELGYIIAGVRGTPGRSLKEDLRRCESWVATYANL